MGSEVLAKGLVALTGLATLGAIFTVFCIVNDINNFYDDAVADLAEFKIYANHAWEDMKPSHQNHVPVRAIFKRSTLQGRDVKSGSQCSCGTQPNNCPAGAPGPRGTPGAPGVHGENGPKGRVGINGDKVFQDDTPQECIKCPRGPPGPQGPDGDMGEPGPDGRHGNNGAPGRNGSPGRDGESGVDGRPGNPGRPGPHGRPGRNGKRGHGKPGPVGRLGPHGAPGRRGENGQPGRNGHDGRIGPAGHPGRNGPAGRPGTPGRRGDEGLPGKDAAYCPCPARSTALFVPEPPVRKTTRRPARRQPVAGAPAQDPYTFMRRFVRRHRKVAV